MDNEIIANKTAIEVFQLNSVTIPVLSETKTNKDWVTFGPKNCHYDYILGLYYGSPTNKTIIDSYTDFIYGKGITASDKAIKPDQYAQMLSIIKKTDLRNIITDFQIFFECCFEVILDKLGQNVISVNHLPKQNVVPGKPDKKGYINTYYHSFDWDNINKYPPEAIPVFETGTTKRKTIYVVKPYQPKKPFFNIPSYSAGLRAAYSEEQLEIYYNNHIDNGLSFGHIVNVVGQDTDEERDKFSKEIKSGLTGAKNAGKVVINYISNPESKTTVESLEVSDAHHQYEFLSANCRQQIMVSHRVTSPILFGIKDNTGFGNNAEEMETAFEHLIKMVIVPKQEFIIDALQEVLSHNDISLKLEIEQLTLSDIISPKTETKTEVQMHSHGSVDEVADYLIELGENEDFDNWECINIETVSDHHILNDRIINLAKVPSSFPTATSNQDNDLFKIRYVYAPVESNSTTRPFCKKMINASKVYRIEDIQLASDKIVNPGFGPNGIDTYDILLYKGGARCRHFWMRKIYLRKSNKNISVNEALKMIRELEPEKRTSVRIPVNDKKVAMQPNDMPHNGFLK